jgi:hypothetical protein
MSEKIKNHDIRMNLAVYPETWQIVNREKLPAETFDGVLRRVFKELNEFRMNVITQAEKDIIQERLDVIDKQGDF